MKIDRQNETLRVSELDHLDASNALDFRAAVGAALGPSIKQVEVDLAHTESIDCGGLGALIALRKSLRQVHPEATLSLTHLAPAIQRLLQLTRTERLFSTPSPEGTVLPLPGLGPLDGAPSALGKSLPEEPLSAVA